MRIERKSVLVMFDYAIVFAEASVWLMMELFIDRTPGSGISYSTLVLDLDYLKQ